jgi:hypothetical protein
LSGLRRTNTTACRRNSAEYGSFFVAIMDILSGLYIPNYPMSTKPGQLHAAVEVTVAGSSRLDLMFANSRPVCPAGW